MTSLHHFDRCDGCGRRSASDCVGKPAQQLSHCGWRCRGGAGVGNRSCARRATLFRAKPAPWSSIDPVGYRATNWRRSQRPPIAHDCIVVPAVLLRTSRRCGRRPARHGRFRSLGEHHHLAGHASLVAGRTVGLAAHSARPGRLHPHPAHVRCRTTWWRRRWPITRSRMYF